MDRILYSYSPVTDTEGRIMRIQRHKLIAIGKFETLPKLAQEFIKEVVANFHIRNGVKNSDGSMGTIEISPGELRDILAYATGLRSQDEKR